MFMLQECEAQTRGDHRPLSGKFDKDLVAAVRESQTGVHRNGRRAMNYAPPSTDVTSSTLKITGVQTAEKRWQSHRPGSVAH
jgi:hypothetical protein